MAELLTFGAFVIRMDIFILVIMSVASLKNFGVVYMVASQKTGSPFVVSIWRHAESLSF